MKKNLGSIYGDMVFNELVRLKVGNQVGYGPVEKNRNTHSFIEYFNKRMGNIKQKKDDAALDRESKWTSIKYIQKSLYDFNYSNSFVCYIYNSFFSKVMAIAIRENIMEIYEYMIVRLRYQILSFSLGEYLLLVR